ncbi:hypothetical protein [Roseibium sp.]|uniref:hypothetical protein n=1 Tax=Roseibium sp. TaxID=1936156 RepID=UPI003A983325
MAAVSRSPHGGTLRVAFPRLARALGRLPALILARGRRSKRRGRLSPTALPDHLLQDVGLSRRLEGGTFEASWRQELQSMQAHELEERERLASTREDLV